MITTTDQSVYDDIKEILIDEYVELLDLYHTFEDRNELSHASRVKIAMYEVDIISRRLIGCDVSPFALKYFQ